MEVLDKQLQKKVRIASRKLGLDEQDLIERAIANYMKGVHDLQNLQDELRAWDMLAGKSMRAHGF